MSEVLTEEDLIREDTKRRWYDDFADTGKTLEAISMLDKDTKKSLLKDLVKIVAQIKDFHKEEDEPEISIGVERVMGLFQSSNSRRWYDKDKKLSYVMKYMSTLPKTDFKNIMEGLSVTLNSENE